MSPPMSVKVSYILSQLLRQWTVILLTLNRSCKAFTVRAELLSMSMLREGS